MRDSSNSKSPIVPFSQEAHSAQAAPLALAALRVDYEQQIDLYQIKASAYNCSSSLGFTAERDLHLKGSITVTSTSGVNVA